MANARILVVDDEEDLCEILKFNLEIEGFDVDTANSAEEALKKDLSVYQLLMLDVMMGEISGFKMANIIRKDESKPKVPIIFLTAKDTENDRLTGFNLGAEDLIIDIPKKKVSIGNEEITLTKKEFEILKLLLEHQGHVFSREEILSRVWSDEVYVLDRTIDVNITRLRKKIGKFGKNIVTRLGYGYCFETA